VYKTVTSLVCNNGLSAELRAFAPSISIRTSVNFVLVKVGEREDLFAVLHVIQKCSARIRLLWNVQVQLYPKLICIIFILLFLLTHVADITLHIL